MEMSQLEVFLGRARVRGYPTRRLLAGIHRGDAFTKVFSLTLKFLAWILGLLIGLTWIGSWVQVYRELERWELILAFVDQFFLLGLLCVVFHVTYLRAGHLRRIPPGYFVSLQATALILRWFGECVLILAIGVLGHALLGVPEPGWMSSLFGGYGSPVSEGDLKAGIRAWSVVSGIWTQMIGFLVFTGCYALASVIEIFLAIERNTRKEQRSAVAEGGVTGRGHEARAPRENSMVSI